MEVSRMEKMLVGCMVLLSWIVTFPGGILEAADGNNPANLIVTQSPSNQSPSPTVNKLKEVFAA
jgi:hypothetical protein